LKGKDFLLSSNNLKLSNKKHATKVEKNKQNKHKFELLKQWEKEKKCILLVGGDINL